MIEFNGQNNWTEEDPSRNFKTGILFYGLEEGVEINNFKPITFNITDLIEEQHSCDDSEFTEEEWTDYISCNELT